MLPKWERGEAVIVVNAGRLRQYAIGKPAVVANDLSHWEATTSAARWLSSADVQATFPAANQISAVGDWAFPMPRCSAVVEALVQFPTGVVLVGRVR